MPNIIKKIVAIVTTVTCAAWMIGPGIAQGATVEELQQQIANLTSQLAALQTQLTALQGGTGAAAYTGIPAGFTFEKNLKVGMSDPDVVYLKIVLDAEVTHEAWTGTQYFGSKTKAAVVAFQEKYASETLASWGLTVGTGFVGSTTRTKLNALLAIAPAEEEEEEEEAPPAGVLTVALAADTPAAAIIPDNSMAVFAKFSLGNGTDADITISSLTLKRVGVGGTSDFDSVYLYDGAVRLTSGRSVSSATNEVQFSSLNLVVAAGTTKVISVKADGASSVSGTHAFQITSADDIVTSATVQGNFPVKGNLLTYSDVDAGTLTVADDGSLANPTLGEEGAEVEKFSLAASDENIKLESIAFEQKGSADMAYLTNWELYRGEDKLADGTVRGDYVTFDLDSSYTIDDGLTKILSVKVDIGGKVDPSDDIDLEIDEAIDVYGVGQTYGYGVGVTDSQTGDDVSVQGGTVTFVDKGPNAVDVKSGGNDITFLKFSITPKINITIKDLDLVAYDSSGNNEVKYLDDIKIRDADTGVTLMGPEDINDTTYATASTTKLDMTEDFDVAANTTKNLMVTADIDEDVTAGTIYQISLAMTTSLHSRTTVAPVIKDSENNNVTDIVPSTNITGELMTVAGAYLTVALSSVPTCTVNVQNNDKVEALGLVLGAGEAEDITITDITVHFTAATGEPEDIISAVYLYDSAGALISGPEVIASADDDAVFDGLNMVISAGGTKKVLVKTDIGSLSAVNSFYADIIGASTTDNISAEDEDGSAVTVYDEDGSANAGDWNSDIYLNDPGTLAADQDCADADVEIELIQTGYLLIENNTDRPDAKIVVAGAAGQALHKVDFTGEYEGFNVQKLTFITTSGSQDNFKKVTLEYPDADGNTVSQTNYFVSNSVTFSGMTMYVPKDETVTLSVKADFNTVTAGSDPDDTIDIDWDYDGAIKVTSDSGTVDENAADASGCITDTSGSVSAFATNLASNNHKIYNTVLTVGNPSPAVSGAVESSAATVLYFTVTADTADKATVQSILFSVAGTVQTENEVTGTADLSFYDAAILTSPLYSLHNVTAADSVNTTATTTATSTNTIVLNSASMNIAVGDVITIDPDPSTTTDTLVTGVLVRAVATTSAITTLTISTLADGEVDLSTVTVGTTAIAATSAIKFLNESSLVIPLEDVAAKTIAKGAAKTFALIGDTTGATPTSGNSTLQVQIATGAYFEWRDDEMATNIASTLLKQFPVTGGTLTYQGP